MKYGEIENHSLFASLKDSLKILKKCTKKVNPNPLENASNEAGRVSISQRLKLSPALFSPGREIMHLTT